MGVVFARKSACAGEHLIEQLKDLIFRADEFRDVDSVCRRIVLGFAYKLAVLPVLQMDVGGVVGDLPAGNRLTGKDAGTVFRLPRADALHGKTLALETFDDGVVGDLSVA